VSANRVCWTREAIDFATQVDVGGLEVDDPHADAVFRAIHQSLPVSEESAGGRSPVSEDDVLRAFTRPITSNEPLLLFVTGEKGTGKSHLVRWLKSRLGSRPSWHVVYIEKRNTSLRRVTERILAGIDTPRARALRQELDRASSEITSDEEAMNALLARLDHLVTFDQAAEIGSLPEVSGAELADLRRKAHRLLGDFTFRRELSVPDGPVHRIVRLARGGEEPSEDVDAADLHLTEADLKVDPSGFDDLGQELQSLIGSLVSNRGVRADLAALCDWYLPRAKAQVFIGQGANLLDVFEDVRKEIANRGQELCLLIEDLVLLHGIDRQLAQALTIPASARLCRLRAAIAVTSGYLRSLDTFTDRGLRYTLDMNLDAIGQTGLRDFVGRYLNAGRLAADTPGSPDANTPNACITCPLMKPCHNIFGTAGDRYGLYPFNGTAVDRLIALASPGEFRPREILRQVIRAPLEVAEQELPVGRTFPSERFARALDKSRSQLDPTLRAAIRKDNTVSAEAEISLRAFYAQGPPVVDADLEEIARYLGDELTPGLTDATDYPDPDSGSQAPPGSKPGPRQPPDEVRRWTDDRNFFLSAPTANSVRRWICETVVAQLQNGPHGVAARKVKGKNEWRIGSHALRLTDIRIDRAHGSGAVERDNPFQITVTDENAALIRGILAVASGGSLDLDGGEWFFRLQTRISDYASLLADLGRAGADTELPPAVETLTVLRHISAEPGQTVRDALTPMLTPALPQPLNPAIRNFLNDTRAVRDEALTALRNHATAAKGTGKPSLLDTGLLYADIRSHLSDLSVSGPPGTLPGRLQAMQSRAFTRAWADVVAAVRAAQRFIDPGEDLAATTVIVDRLVGAAHTNGKLPRADFAGIYHEARANLTPNSMEIYRQLSKKMTGDPGPGDIWDICPDPLPRLEALTRYAAVTNELLDGVASKLVPAPGGGLVDAGALIQAFRDLADLLDDMARPGGR
jgi:AAA ATPase domain